MTESKNQTDDAERTPEVRTDAETLELRRTTVGALGVRTGVRAALGARPGWPATESSDVRLKRNVRPLRGR